MSLDSTTASMDDSSETSFKIEKLHGRSNWAAWKFDMEMVLTDKDLWDVTEKEAQNAATDAKVMRKSKRALAQIALAVDRCTFELARQATTRGRSFAQSTREKTKPTN